MGRFRFSMIALVLAAFCSSGLVQGCGCGSGGAGGSGYVGAQVKDAYTGDALPDASIDFQNSSGLSVKILITDGSGKIFDTVPTGTTYIAVISKAGYISENYYDIDIDVFNTTYLETIPLVPDSFSGNGSFSGTIINAFDGLGIAGHTVEFRRGINATGGAPIASITTDGSGMYTVADVEAGVYTAIIPAQDPFGTGRFLAICFGGMDNPDQDGVVSPVLPAGQTRIVLSWGISPDDLDSHLYGPKPGGGEFHTWYQAREFYEGGTLHAALDLDDVYSYGPETSTIYVESTGTYKFIVYDYTNGSSGYFNTYGLASSGAKVRLFRGSACIATFDVPNEAGTLWTVFEMSGATITPKNTMAGGIPPGT